jgi:hypothetical protein
MSARDIIVEIVSHGVAPAAKSAGFKKSALNFHRRVASVIQVINFQLSQGNFADQGRFYVNVGLAFDALWLLEGRPIPDRPREVKCHFRRRIEQLVPGVPSAVDVTSKTDIVAASQGLRSNFDRLLTLLDPIQSPEAMLETGWLKIGSEIELRACLNYVLGRYPDAMRDLKEAAEFFSDRQGMSVDALIKQYKLKKLKTLR